MSRARLSWASCAFNGTRQASTERAEPVCCQLGDTLGKKRESLFVGGLVVAIAKNVLNPSAKIPGGSKHKVGAGLCLPVL